MFSSVLLFFEFGAGEIMFIMMVALLLFGGDKLPGLARGLGKGIRDFKDASEGVKREINNQIDNFETKKASQAPATVAATETVVNQSPESAEKSEAPKVAPPVMEPPANAVPVSEFSSNALVEPVNTEANAPAHLKETPIENVLPEPANTHEEHKS